MLEIKAENIEKIISENAAFGYIASKWEISADYWHRFMTPSERLNLSQKVGVKGLKQSYEACLKMIENAL